MGDTKAIFWIATPGYAHEVKASQRTVTRHMPGIPRETLIAGDNLPGRKHSLWYLDFVYYMNEALRLPCDRLLYLDTDIHMAAPVGEIFDILDRFDIVSTIAPARIISPTSIPIPETLAEWNTGVLAFRNNEAVRRLFRSWYSIYCLAPDLYGENDQAPLREALWQWDGRPYVMPQEYNCRFGFGGQAAGTIKILHGRSANMAGLAENINKNTGIRSWRRGDYQ